jgi:aldose 1-epimerase
MTGPTLDPLGVHHEGRELMAVTLESPAGVTMRVLNLGGTVWSLHAPDPDGALADVVLGYDDPLAYVRDEFYVGGIIGRTANRVAHARFTLDGAPVHLTANHGRDHLHGGARGFNKVLWGMKPFARRGERGVVLEYTSPDGEEGYPGTLLTRVTYTLTDDNVWEVAYVAEADRPTPVNLTQHSYFNLAGRGSVRGHLLRVDADRYLPQDDERIPTGALESVKGTALDLRVTRTLGTVLDDPELPTHTLDHTFVLPDRVGVGDDALLMAAELSHPASGRVLTVTTTEPSVHCYAARYLVDLPGKSGERYQPHSAICLETQHFPDSPNRPEFPSTIVRPGAPYRSRTRFAFSAPRRAD